MMNGRRPRVLVLDDDELIRSLFQEALGGERQYEVVAVGSCREAERLCRDEEFDLIFLDHNLPEGIGWDLARMALEPRPGRRVPRVVLMSGTVREEDLGAGEKYDDLAPVFSKPFSLSELYELVDRLLSR